MHEEPVISTVDVERTFWEKVTILHKTAASYKQKGIPSRYARHYYDLYQMSHSEVKDRAFSRRELLEQDIRFKLKFYYAKNASYETARMRDILASGGCQDDTVTIYGWILSKYPAT